MKDKGKGKETKTLYVFLFDFEHIINTCLDQFFFSFQIQKDYKSDIFILYMGIFYPFIIVFQTNR